MIARTASSGYNDIVAARRALRISGFATFADVGLDGDWVTPYQIASRSPTGPVLLTYNYLDAPSAVKNRAELRQFGYLDSMPFNQVLSGALCAAVMTRADVYVTHVFHLLPASRSAAIPVSALDISFDAIARQELLGRQVIALGRQAERACRRHGITHVAVPHLSARGLTYATRAARLAEALRRLA